MLPAGEPGIITDVSGDTLTIQLTNDDVCDDCGLRLVCKPGEGENRSLQITYPGNFIVGQRVRLEEEIDLELRLTLIQYVFPLIMFIAGLLLFYLLPSGNIPQELLSFIGGCLGLFASFWVSRHWMQSLARSMGGKAIRLVPLISSNS